VRGGHNGRDCVSDMHGPLVQAMEESWGSLCCNMMDNIFVSLSLLDLWRAAPTCRDFRAAYKARLSVEHRIAVAKAVPCFGGAFLQALGTLIFRLSNGMDLISGERYRGLDPNFYMSCAGAFAQSPDAYTLGWRSPSRVSCWKTPDSDGFFERKFVVIIERGFVRPALTIHCVRRFRQVHIVVGCEPAHCREAARAVAAVLTHLHVESTSTACRKWGKPLKYAIVFNLAERRATDFVDRPSEADVSGIVAALLPLSTLVEIEQVSWLFRNHFYDNGILSRASLWKLQAMCR
jgi:hypothetical protein